MNWISAKLRKASAPTFVVEILGDPPRFIKSHYLPRIGETFLNEDYRAAKVLSVGHYRCSESNYWEPAVIAKYIDEEQVSCP